MHEYVAPALIVNPFEVTKAINFSNEEIIEMWVDLEDGGFFELINPAARTPRMLLGGKGSGRTHLMRYYSAPLQVLRSGATEAPWTSVLAEGYIGIYLLCSGMNAGRFHDKGISEEQWRDVFAYSMDLWLAQLAIDAGVDVFGGISGFEQAENDICREIVAEFDQFQGDQPENLADLKMTIHELQRELDLAVNNASVARKLDVVIRSTPGRLPIAVPRAMSKRIPNGAHLRWLFLIDELENLDSGQQEYIQTLIREREDPVSYLVGARTYGFRTRKTYGGGEENKVGSEFDQTFLDQFYLDHYKKFNEFCLNLASRRLVNAGQVPDQPAELAGRLSECFETFDQSSSYSGDSEVQFALAADKQVRPYLRKLARQLREHGVVRDEKAAKQIVDKLAAHEYPLVEKLNVLLFYQRWYAGDPSQSAAEDISRKASAFVEARGKGEAVDESYVTAFKHYRDDLLAQMLADFGKRQRYLGIDTFVRMSGGLPRNFLQILNRIHRCAVFNGEAPFGGKPLTERSQREGVLQASDWFYRDAMVEGTAEIRVDDAMTRLGGFLRAHRFSDKPVEVSPASFSVDESAISLEARNTIELSRQWSLLLRIGSGERDRNTRGVIAKYQVNPMICPRWDLPLARRGVMRLKPYEVEAIFDGDQDAYADVLRRGTSRWNAPFRAGDRSSSSQGSLLD